MPPSLSNVTVLILDDNPLVLKLGRALLEREGCTVLTAVELDRVQSRPGQQLPRHHLSRRQPAQHQGQPPERSAQVAVEQEGHPHRPDLRPSGEIARRDVPELRRQRLDAQAADARQDGRHDQSLREMTDETRILRTVGIPIVIAIMLLFVVPKMCVKAVVVAKARQEKAARESGLHIESTQKPATYPAGLDADRVRYLVEIDNRFLDAVHRAHRKSGGAGDDAADHRCAAETRLRRAGSRRHADADPRRPAAPRRPRRRRHLLDLPRRHAPFRIASSRSKAIRECARHFAWKWQPNTSAPS